MVGVSLSIPDDVVKKLLEKTGKEKIQDAIRYVLIKYLNEKDIKSRLENIEKIVEDIRDKLDKILDRLEK